MVQGNSGDGETSGSVQEQGRLEPLDLKGQRERAIGILQKPLP